MNIKTILTIISSLTFISYGLLCVFNGHMRQEFQRYRLEKFRILTGSFELLGGVGLLVGLFLTPVFYLSAFGLAVLMLLGVIVRIRIKDKFQELLPALILMILNAYLFVSEYCLATI